MLAALSTFIFSINTRTFEELRTSRNWNWSEQPIVGKYPKLSFVSASAPIVTLSGRVYPGQLHRFANLADYLIVSLAELSARKNQPLPFLIGANPSLFMGFFVIESYENLQTTFARGGSQRQDFTVTLKQAKPPPTTLL